MSNMILSFYDYLKCNKLTLKSAYIFEQLHFYKSKNYIASRKTCFDTTIYVNKRSVTKMIITNDKVELFSSTKVILKLFYTIVLYLNYIKISMRRDEN